MYSLLVIILKLFESASKTQDARRKKQELLHQNARQNKMVLHLVLSCILTKHDKTEDARRRTKDTRRKTQEGRRKTQDARQDA